MIMIIIIVILLYNQRKYLLSYLMNSVILFMLINQTGIVNLSLGTVRNNLAV